MHINGMTLLGAEGIGDKFVSKRLIGNDVFFKKISVGATVNALLLASSAEGRSRIFGYAKEPHVISLVDFLRSAGADITLFEDRIEVVGSALHGADAYVIPDMIEAGTYTALSLLTGSDIKICNIQKKHLSSFFDTLIDAGALLEFENDSVRAYGELSRFVNIITEPYPGFPTDLQPQMAPLLSRFLGGRITENVWKGRFGYLTELSKFGLKYEMCGSDAIIRHSSFHSAVAKAPDLRGGAALLMCALMAEGESIIDSSDIIKRGYSDIVRKLRNIGADIEEIN
jgi:UDP-N-acetylglucosamine 1-carboxyvinyltransferase